MTEKRVTIILYAGDRTLWRGGAVQIQVSDVFASGGPRLLYAGMTEESTLELTLQLPFDSRQVYGLTLSAPDHHPAWQLIWRPDFLRGTPQVERDDVILRLMLVPKRPGTTDLALAYGRLVAEASPFAGPEGLSAEEFAGLPSAAQMACCNVEAKLRESLVEGASLLSYVRAIRHVAVDRAFVYFDASLKPRVARAADFAAAPGHGAPKAYPDLPAHPDSWKHTRFPEGNIQLSFSAEPFPFAEGGGAMVHSADVDIDLGRGLAHAKEWLENNVFRPGHKTDQVLIYALLYAQNILPRYTLDPMAATVGRALTQLVKVSPQRRPRPAATTAQQKTAARAPAKRQARTAAKATVTRERKAPAANRPRRSAGRAVRRRR